MLESVETQKRLNKQEHSETQNTTIRLHKKGSTKQGFQGLCR